MVLKITGASRSGHTGFGLDLGLCNQFDSIDFMMSMTTIREIEKNLAQNLLPFAAGDRAAAKRIQLPPESRRRQIGPTPQPQDSKTCWRYHE